MERGFSADKEYIKENQSENCLVSLRNTYNRLSSKIRSARSARLKYEQFQLETLKKKKATEKQLKRKINANELEQVKQKKICLQESV